MWSRPPKPKHSLHFRVSTYYKRFRILGPAQYPSDVLVFDGTLAWDVPAKCSPITLPNQYMFIHVWHLCQPLIKIPSISLRLSQTLIIAYCSSLKWYDLYMELKGSTSVYFDWVLECRISSTSPVGGRWGNSGCGIKEGREINQELNLDLNQGLPKIYRVSGNAEKQAWHIGIRRYSILA